MSLGILDPGGFMLLNCQLLTINYPVIGNLLQELLSYSFNM